MARQISQSSVSSSEIDSINLTRLLDRLQRNVLSSSADPKLLRSSQHRARINTNLEYARTLLLRLEHSSSTIKIQSRKQATQTDLYEKRELIKQLSTTLNDFAQADDGDASASESDDDTAEDLLGEETKLNNGTTSHSIEDPSTPNRRKTLDEPNTLRSRRTQPQPSETTTSTSLFTSRSPSSANQTTPETLTSHASEQETLTSSLLALASQLKSSTLTFAQSLEAEQSVLSRATEGLDRNTSGMEAAGKKMGALRRMSEGKGWLGRIMLYAWIFGLMVIAVLLVFVGPKFRF